MPFYRYAARYVFNDVGNDHYYIRSLVPFSIENEKNKYFVHCCYTTEKDDSQSVYVVSFGYERDWPDKVEGPIRKDRFAVCYVMSGRGFFNGTEVKGGQFFFTHPYESYTISDDPNDPMEYYYMSAAGKGIVELMQKSGFLSIPKISDFHFGDKVAELIGNALYNVPENVDYELYFYGVFMQLMAYHRKENKSIINNSQKLDRYTYYKKAVVFINECILDGISATDVARHLHISPSYLRSIFSEFCQYSVRELIVRKKMDCAMNYMMCDDYTVERVARLLRYEDYNQFSKIFKKYTGMSPLAYKKANASGKDNSQFLDTVMYEY